MIAVLLLALLAVVPLSLFSGTLVWSTAVEAFPRLVAEGWIARDIHWTTAVCLSFVCNLLIKASQTNNGKG